MKRIKNFIVLSFALIAVSFVSANAQNYSGRAPRPAKTLEQQVFKEIITLPRYGVFDHIAFQVNGSTVTLYGKVISLGTRKDAENVVRRIPGVTRVVNNIEELPPSSFDNQIRYRLLRTFTNTAGLWPYLSGPSPSVRIIVENGRVSLEGYVPNRGTSNTMNILANGVPGVFNVQNNLIIGSQAS